MLGNDFRIVSKARIKFWLEALFKIASSLCYAQVFFRKKKNSMKSEKLSKDSLKHLMLS